MTYTDYDANKYTKRDLITVTVGSVPDLGFWVDSSDLYAKGTQITLPVKFVNKGITDIKFLYVELGSSTGYDLVSPKQVYLGKVDSDDYETAEYILRVRADAEDTLKLPLHIKYQDENNKEYTIDEEMLLPVYGADKIKELNPSSGGMASTIFIVLAIVVVLYIGYRLFFKKKK